MFTLFEAITSGRVALTNYYHNELATCGAKSSVKSSAKRKPGAMKGR